MTRLTEDQIHVLQELKRRPSGSFFREDTEKEAILELCEQVLVCDPDESGSAMFTRITDKGLKALEDHEQDPSSPAPSV